MSESKRLKIAVFGNAYQDPYLSQLKELFAKLADNAFVVDIERNFHDYLSQRIGDFAFSKVVEIPSDDYALVLSIGGDGTFLHTAQWVGDRGLPILGINTGHLGFLSMYRLEEVWSLKA